MRLLLDHNVPVSVAKVFQAHGHEVVLLKDILPTDAKDKLVATVAELNELILVSFDQDFKQIAPRIPRGYKGAVKKLSRITLNCHEPKASGRVEIAMSFIEFEYQVSQESADKRMLLWIRDDVLRTHR